MKIFRMFKLASTLAVEISSELARISNKITTEKEAQLLMHIVNFIRKRTF